MKLSKKEEAELIEVYNTWWDSYLNGDVKTYDYYLEDDFRFVGSTGSEEFLNRKAATDFFADTAEQLAGKTKRENSVITLEPMKDMVLVTDLADAYVKSDSEWVYYARFRFTSMMRHTKNGWRFFYQHFSTPDLKAQEGETIGTEKISAENLELRSAIKRRTAELEIKNRALEIEGALDRIRVQANAMRQSSDLLDIVVTMRNAFNKLGHRADYFWHMMYLPDKYEKAMTSGDGSQIGMVMELPRDFHSHYAGMSEWEAGDEPIMILPLEVEDAVDYVDKMITLGNFQKVDPNAPTLDDIRHIGGITFVMARTSHGEIGYSLPGVVKDPPEEDLRILERFAGAFDLAHRRFLDLQKAEKQAREVEIELALEKVRSRSIGMRKSEELREVIQVIHDQLIDLNFEIDAAGFTLDYHQNNDWNTWIANKSGSLPSLMHIPYIDHPQFNYYKNAKEKGLDFLANTLSFEDKNSIFTYMFGFMGDYPQEEKDELLSKPGLAISQAFLKNISLWIYNLDAIPYSDEDNNTLMRFAKVFEQTYIRFNDLKKAEAQAREAQIEAALERVRARTMAMQQSEELADVATVLFQQVKELGIPQWTCGFNIWESGDEEFTFYPGGPDGEILDSCKVPLNEHPIFRQFEESRKRGDELYVYEKEGEMQKDHYRYMHSLPGIGDMLQGMLDQGLEFPEYQIDHIANFAYGNMIFITYEPFPEMHNVFVRFAKVFEQTYTRFLDLQKAEAQAREAQIEAALERVRSRSMGMHRSSEIGDVAYVLFEQLKSLGGELWGTGFGFCQEDSDADEFWFANENGIMPPLKIPNTKDPAHRQMYKGWKENLESFSMAKGGKELKDHYKYMLSVPDVSPIFQEMIDNDIQFPDWQKWHAAYFQYGYLLVITKEIYENEAVFNRFAKVFEQAYTRFLDLQKAEDQAREAQIEVAMERIRNRSLAMHSSEELMDVITELRRQIDSLGQLDLEASVIHLYHEDEPMFESIAAVRPPGESGEIVLANVFFPVDATDQIKHMIEMYASDKTEYTIEFGKEMAEEWQEVMMVHAPEIAQRREGFVENRRISDHSEYWNFADFSSGSLLLVTHSEASEDTKEVLRKAAQVFDLAYRRFKDLKKAEAQAREANIEGALERVRSRTMGMQQSQELGEVATVLFKELNELVDNLWTCGFVLCEKDRNEDEWWLSTEQGFIPAFYLPNIGDATHHNIYNAWEKGETYHTEQLEGDALLEHYDWLMNIPEAKKIFDEMEADGFERPSWQKLHCAYFSYGYLVMITRVPCPEEEIFKRFAKVFDQTYRRFLDLQRAEAQAREAKIEAALEKVRSRTMAMQKGEELKEVVVLLYKELISLGVTNFVTCGYVEINEEIKRQITWVTSPGGDSLGLFYLPLTGDATFDERYAAWQQQQPVFHQKVAGEVRRKHLEYAITTFNSKEAEEMVLGQFPDPTVFYCFNFSHGYLHLVTGSELTNEEEGLLARFTRVFEQTYARFLDLQKAEAQAREAQIEAALERVRSRSMAMHQSQELKEVIQEVYDQFVGLDIHIEHTGFIMDYKANDDMHIWLADRHEIQSEISFPYFDCDYWNSFNEAKQKGLDFFVTHLGFEEKNKFYEDLFQLISDVPEESMESYLSYEGLSASTVLMENVGLYIENFSGIPYTDEENAILMRFGKVFQQTYTRFLDLQKAEAQARESQIEAALERVRASSMAMHKTKDIADVVVVFFKQLKLLRVNFVQSWINVVHPEEGTIDVWFSPLEGIYDDSTFLKMPISIFENTTLKSWKAGESFSYASFKSKEEVEALFQVCDEATGSNYFSHIQEKLQLERLELLDANYKFGAVSKSDIVKATPEEEAILKRFAKVFEQAYTRFLDLQKAEAQTREAQIEASLERVRSKTMAMHNSEDVGHTVIALFDEVVNLGLDNSIRCGIGILENRTYMETWSANLKEDGDVVLRVGLLNMEIHPMLQGLKKAWEKGKEGYSYDFIGDDVHRYYEALNREPEYPFNANLENLPKQEYHKSFFFSSGILFAFSENPFSEETSKVLDRFSDVFGQTYRRYLDLQKAEEQVRESQIEAALEKVRSRTMAMQSSSELVEAANLLFRQVRELGINAWSTGYNVLSDDKTQSKCWMSSEDQLQDPFPLYYTEEASFIEMGNFLKGEEDFFVQELGGEDLIQHYDYMKSVPELFETFKGLEQAGLTLPTYQINHLCKFSKGYLLFITYEKVPEAHDIFKRFARVFEQTYTRFLDLEKAEKQSREAQIELALERVRASTMAMHQSEQLAETAEVLFEQFDLLGVTPDRISIAIFKDKKNIFELWATDQSGSNVDHVHDFSVDEPTCVSKIYKAWKEEKETFVVDLKGKALKDWVRYVKEEAKMELDETKFKGRRVQNCAFFSQGFLLLSSHLTVSKEILDLLLRFAKVFQQTYTRFLDLQRAEAQAREAVKHASVDRVRAEIASMRTTTDLKRITPLIWNELTTLNVPFIRCGVFIMDETKQQVQTHLSTPDGKAIASFNLPFENTKPLTELLPYWRKKEMYVEYWDELAFVESTKILMERGAIGTSESYVTDSRPTNLYLHFLPFLQGMLYVGSEVPLSEDELNLAQNLAQAFSTAYSRYEDFNRLELAKQQIEKTLVDLKQTQNQLIQSEKMASLGELTAGIAHEIQNPLNFVNNFSEVSHELMKEMQEEIEKGDLTEALEIGTDIEQNLEKINHHGKRASDIVKGMLQHSRSNSGERESTDLNALTDEYLRLAYHGLRAKDKSFNVKMDTEFEPDLEKVSIVPQDIGRVILNLITNAFYVVDEKKKSGLENYEPTVFVGTKKNKDRIEVIVKDNGNGIPKEALDKIFQPFFTTKPTGKGTGLGLSLSYDIVKAHGGEIKVDTTKNKGTEFVIILPVN